MLEQHLDGDISNAYLAVNLRSIKAAKTADLLTVAISCYSVMYSHQIGKGKLQLRFIISGGTMMTIVNIVKGMVGSNGDLGNLLMQE